MTKTIYWKDVHPQANIKVRKETKDLINRNKEHPAETYQDVILRWAKKVGAK